HHHQVLALPEIPHVGEICLDAICGATDLLYRHSGIADAADRLLNPKCRKRYNVSALVETAVDSSYGANEYSAGGGRHLIERERTHLCIELGGDEDCNKDV